MWETAERAGVVTANLMWYVAWKLLMAVAYGVFQARPSQNDLRSILDILYPLEGIKLNTG
jgi:hypothetical protein